MSYVEVLKINQALVLKLNSGTFRAAEEGAFLDCETEVI
jgi:hypothetical protein